MKLGVGRREEGQVLIQVTIALVVLLAFVSLAVDGSYTYSERRHMQNAADAGALAGAREICFGTPSQAETVARDYATVRNRAQTADVSVEDWMVVVTATETIDLFFASFVGFPSIDVGAKAKAACGSATRACGLWPVAFEAARYDELYDGGAGCGQQFYVWDDDKIVDCATYDCDLDDDGIDDVVAGGDRGWLDFSEVVDPEYPDACVQSGCGESELECHIRRNEGALVELAACIPGDSGVKAGVKDGVQSRIGDSVGIPLFDSIGCPTGRTCPGGLSYHVTRFGCIKVVSWEQSLKLDAKDGTGNTVGKAIVVEIDCDGCATPCGGTDGSPPVPGGLNAVSLIR